MSAGGLPPPNVGKPRLPPTWGPRSSGAPGPGRWQPRPGLPELQDNENAAGDAGAARTDLRVSAVYEIGLVEGRGYAYGAHCLPNLGVPGAWPTDEQLPAPTADGLRVARSVGRNRDAAQWQVCRFYPVSEHRHAPEDRRSKKSRSEFGRSLLYPPARRWLVAQSWHLSVSSGGR